MYVCMYVCMFLSVYIYIYIYIGTFECSRFGIEYFSCAEGVVEETRVCIYIQTNIHTNIHTYIYHITTYMYARGRYVTRDCHVILDVWAHMRSTLDVWAHMQRFETKTICGYVACIC